jgi:hypothetical protein
MLEQPRCGQLFYNTALDKRQNDLQYLLEVDTADSCYHTVACVYTFDPSTHVSWHMLPDTSTVPGT